MARKSRPSTYSELQVEIGDRIKWARELVEPNRAQFARAMGVDRSTLQKIEDGGRPPSVFNVLEIAFRLKVSTDYILRGSMQGVDGELAARLGHLHPELLTVPSRQIRTPSTATDGGTSRPPRKRDRPAA